MSKSLSCIFAAIATTVAVTVSPVAGVALADPTTTTVPVPVPLPTEPTVVQEEVQPALDVPVAPPPVQDVPLPAEQLPAPSPVQELPPVVSVPQTELAPLPTPPVDSGLDTSSVQEEPQAPPVQDETQQPSLPVEQELPPVVTQTDSEEPVSQAEGALVTPPSASQPRAVEPVLPGEGDDPQLQLPNSVVVDQPNGSLPPGEGPPMETEPLPPLESQNESTLEEQESVLVNKPEAQDLVVPEPAELLTREDERILAKLENEPPVEAAIFDAQDSQARDRHYDDHDWDKGRDRDHDKDWPRWPVPGRDKVDHDWDHHDRHDRDRHDRHDRDDRHGPPKNYGIKWRHGHDGRPVIINYTKQVIYVNITNINVVNNVHNSVKVVPVYPGRPVYLGHNWCGGTSGTFGWSANFGVTAPGTSARFAAGGAFTTGHGCGVHLPPPVHQLPYVKIRVRHDVRPVYARANYYNECGCLVVNNNTFLYGKWTGQQHHSEFVPTSYKTDVAFQQQPIAGVPRWLFDTGVNPTSQATNSLSTELREWAPLLLISGGVLITAVAGVAYYRRRQFGGGDGA